MKLKEKIIGAVGILALSLVFLISGYLINKKDEEAHKQIFTENQQESIFRESNSKEKGTENYKVEKLEKNTEKNNGENKYIIVDIKGAVVNPKEYSLLEGARVRELIEAAGGLTAEADENSVHFSKVLKDEECIVVYKKGEIQTTNSISTNPLEVVQGNKNEKLNINKATLDQLATLYGIGEVKAKAIIEYREKNGGFKSIEDLDKVDGIGSKTVDKLRDKVDIKWVLV